MKEMEKKKIKWEWKEMNGTYEGEVKGWMSSHPHGVGRWTRDDGKQTVEGEWKDGKGNGKAVRNWSDGDRDEYEAKDGKYNGKYITYYDDGRRWQMEYKDGKWDGRCRRYDRDGVITKDAIYENDKQIKQLK